VSTAAVTLDAVTFTYPDAPAPALMDATFALPEGCFVLVAGPTGAGKSTLLRTFNGLVPHFTGGSFAGRVLVGGRDTRDLPPRRLADVVGFVPQDPAASFVVDRVEDELAYVMENLGIEATSMRRRVEEVLDLLGIEGLRTRSVRTLSGGERQRVAIAAALTARPRVLVLDEPTSQLDPQGAEDVLAALQRMVHDLGLTVVIAEHRLERVAGFADVAVGCRAGIAPQVGAPADVLGELDLGPPVARLGLLMKWRPVPLTVRAARRAAAGLSLGAAPSSHRAEAGELLLEAERLTAGYGERTVLHDVDLDIVSGGIVALVGRNGAGKTTLLRCLAGLHTPASGTVRARASSPRTGVDVALCPQDPDTVLFRDRVVDEVKATKSTGALRADPEALLGAVQIDHLADCHPRDLSAGQRLLVALAAIAATGAPVLLLDEPTRGLDAETKKSLIAFMRAHASGARGVVFATHDVELVAEVATRVVMIAGGEVIADGSPSDVLGDSPVFAPQMARVFGNGWLTPEEVAAAVTA
jgi:energy-coupling factor transport system ATP-binding protein